MNTAEDIKKEIAILIVDDDQSTRKSLSLIFKKRGYETHAVATGREALDAARERPFNAALLDIRLPDIQGTELIKPLKKIHPDIAIIVATGFATLDTSMAALNRGAVGYITKPLNMDEVLARLEDVLEKQRLVRENRRLYEELQQELAQRKKDEEKIKKAADEWRITFDSITDLISIHDKDYRFVRVNRAMADFLKVSPGELVGRHCYEVVHGTKKPSAFCPHGEVLKRKKSVERELFDSRLQMHFYLADSPLLDENDDIVGSVHVMKDITERKRAEDALRESEARFADLYENAPDMFLSVDAKTARIIRCNGTLARQTGYSKDELIGRPVFDLYHPDFVEYVRNTLFPLFQKTGEVQDEELKIARKDGTPIDVLLNTTAVRDKNGKILSSRSIWRDISTRKLAEQQLKESEAFIKAVLDNLPVGIAVNSVDPAVTFSYMNDNFPKLYRTTREKLADPDAFWEAAYEDPAFREEIRKRVLDDCAGGDPERMQWIDVPITRTGQETSFITARNIPVPDKPLMISVVWDVTKRKRAEDALKQSEEKLRGITEIVPEAFFIYSAQTSQYEYLSPAFEEMFGRSLADHYENPALWYETVHPDDRQRVALDIFNSLNTGFAIDFRIVRPDGTVRWIFSRSFPECDEKGNILRLIGANQDITERKLAEEALREWRDRYELVVAASGQIAYEYHVPSGEILWGPTIKRVLGYGPDEYGGGFQQWLEWLHPDDKEETLRYLAESEEACAYWDAGYRLRAKDGRYVWIRDRGFFVPDENGKAMRQMGMLEDITERKLAAEALRESEEKYRSLVENINDVLFNIDLDGTITYISPVAEDITGFTVDDYMGKNFSEFVHPEDIADLSENFKRALTGTKEDAEFRTRTKDDSYIYTRSSSNPIVENGSIVGLTGLITDITERKRAEEALKKEQQDILLILDSSPIIIFYIDIEGKIVRVNKTFAEGLKLTEEEIVGKTILDLFPPEAARSMTRDDQEVIESGRPKLNIIDWYESADGMRWLQTDKIPIIDTDNRVIGLAGFAQDITDRKRAEEAMRDSEEKFHSLFETSKDFLCITDLEGKIIDANETALNFFGYSYGELPTIGMEDLYAHPEDREKITNKILEKGYVSNYEMKLKKKDGETIDALMTVNLRRDKNGDPIGFFGSAKDITEKRKMEQQLLQSEKLSAVGTMISGVAHELNNPLTSIIGNSQLLAKRDVPEDIKRKLEIILKESIRSAKIVSGLLAFAREHRPEQKMIAVNDILEETIKLREYDLAVSNIDLRLSLSDDLPRTFADPYQLQQVFINLINNARDALIEQEGAALIIRTYRDKNRIFLDFEDNGSGIEKEDLAKIFDPFFTTKEVGKGTGLGLSMAYGIIKEHDGTITVESEPEKGAKFVVALPIREGVRSAPKKKPPPVKTSPDAKTVLVVEDEQSLRELLVEAVSGGGFSADAAATGQEAITMIGEKKYDAVVSDIKMPGIDGRELYLFIQKNHPEIADKIIFITGDILSRDTQSFLQITNNRFMEKPFNIDAFLALLGDVLAG